MGGTATPVPQPAMSRLRPTPGSIPLALALALVLACSVPTKLQAQTVPSSLEGVEGGSATIFPFGFDTPIRLMCIYNADQLPFSDPTLIRGVRLRADGQINPGSAVAMEQKGFITMDVWMSTSSVRAEDASEDFDDNHGNDVARVVNFSRIVLPQQEGLADPSQRPRGFDIDIPFEVQVTGEQTNWHYKKTPWRRRGEKFESLVLDFRILSQPGGVYYMDSPFFCVSQAEDFGLPGCPTGSGATVELTSDSADPQVAGANVQAGSSVTYRLSNLPPNAPFVVFAGLSDQGQFAGRPLPVHLGGDPTSSDPLAQPPFFFPAQNCHITVSPALTAGGAADADGNATTSLTLPSDLRLVGEQIHAQAVVVDITANLLGVVTSNSSRVQVCGPLGIAWVHQLGDPQAETGNYAFGTSLVVEVY